MDASSDNAIAIEAWNGVLFEKFRAFKHVLTAGLSVHGEEALRRHPIPAGARVLDVGCGFGDTTRALAQCVGPTGSAIGVDAAASFVAAATRDAHEAGIENARFRVADAQHADLGGPYDHVFARFGTMFFASPVAAMRNIARSLVPGGALTMVVWRRREDNAWLHRAELAVRRIVPVVRHEDTGAVHCGPGPFSMASADVVSDVLTSAGFDHIALERFDADICIGEDLDRAVEFSLVLGPAGEILRLAAEAGVRRPSEAAAAIRDALASFERDDGVWAPSSTWLVSARRAR